MVGGCVVDGDVHLVGVWVVLDGEVSGGDLPVHVEGSGLIHDGG